MKYRDSSKIKVLTGPRGVGKSAILAMWERQLLSEGIPAERVLRLNLESLRCREIRDGDSLYERVVQMLPAGRNSFLMLDEVQTVEGWEQALKALTEKSDLDIILAGSHRKILSEQVSESSKSLVEIPVFPLSFREFLEFYPYEERIGREQLFSLYLQFGGFPLLAEHPFDEARAEETLKREYAASVLQDVIHQNRISDIALLEDMMRLFAAETGRVLSLNAVSRQLAEDSERRGKAPAVRTVESYTGMLERAGLLFRVPVYDIRRQEVFQRIFKLYLADSGYSSLFIDMKSHHLSFLEQAVYLELRRLGAEVSVGRIYEKETGFIARRGTEKIYVCVVESMKEEEIRSKVLGALQAVPDQHVKWVLTMDKENADTEGGIRISNLTEFLMAGR